MSMIDVRKAAQLWNDHGHTQGQIAEYFGVTRNTIAGLINRNREMFNRRGSPPMLAEAKKREAFWSWPKPPRKSPQKPAKAVDEVVQSEASPIDESTVQWSNSDATAYDLTRMQYARDLLRVSSCECMWALTDRAPHMFCAAPVKTGSRYCYHHNQRSKGAGTSSERRAIRDMKRAVRRHG